VPSIIFPKNKSNLASQSRDQIVSRLTESLSGRVLAAFIFGSFAIDSHHAHSDIDLILVYTPAEFERQMLKAKNPGFWQDVQASLLKIA